MKWSGCFVLLCCLTWAGSLLAEPLRVVIPAFFGPAPMSQQVRTTFYFEIVKAFRDVDQSQKGAWILYGGQNKVATPTHDAILDATTWPSVRADLALWGQVHKFDDGAVVQLNLSLTPLLKQREVRPEIWRLSLRNRAGQHSTFELDIPGKLYTFEPLLLTPEAIMKFSTPQGIALYSSRGGVEQIGTVGADVLYFYEVYDDAVLIETNNKKGWVRTPPIAKQESEAVAFSRGLVRLLRGDWHGARESFDIVLASSNLPQELRIYALFYRGLAKEKGGEGASDEFEMAYRLNPLDRSAAAYLLMSRLADISRLQAKGDVETLNVAWQRLRQTLDISRQLFAVDDPWFTHIDKMFR